MADIWDFFENMDELVYVADMDTYDMVYMNRRQWHNTHLHHLNSIRTANATNCSRAVLLPVPCVPTASSAPENFLNGPGIIPL